MFFFSSSVCVFLFFFLPLVSFFVLSAHRTPRKKKKQLRKGSILGHVNKHKRMLSKHSFQRFIDESYFGYQFRYWSAAFFVVGIVLIVVGGVLGSTLPAKQNAAYNMQQLITSTDTSANGVYENWLVSVHKTPTWTGIQRRLWLTAFPTLAGQH